MLVVLSPPSLQLRLYCTSSFTITHNITLQQYSGKRNCVAWLLQRLEGEGAGDGSAAANGASAPPPPYAFMGDDDNDVQAGQGSATCYVTRPHSDKMAAFIAESESQQKQEQQRIQQRGGEGAGTRIVVAESHGTRGTEENLRAFLSSVRRSKHAASEEL
jgi:hypothetical protein